MTMTASQNRIGLHYFPDTQHYREADIQFWLPRLQEIGAGWLVLQATAECAIPEVFLNALTKAKIQPLLHLRLPLDPLPEPAGLRPIFDAYARWGVRRVILFDQPNSRSAWPSSAWAQQDLVERFLDRYLIFAQMALSAGLQPVLPPLEPGGHYWDTAFLRSTLKTLQRRKQEHLLEQLGLAAYAWNNGRGLDWGAGGPERWPATRPYHTPEGSQDQRGFRIADWYQVISQAVLQRPLPTFLLQAGGFQAADPAGQAESSLAIARLLLDEEVVDPQNAENLLDPLPSAVQMAAFWLLSAPDNDPHSAGAWFDTEGQPRPVAQAFREWQVVRAQADSAPTPAAKSNSDHPIEHYLLLPQSENGLSDWYLDAIRPYLRRHMPTFGFSAAEAALARKVTVLGDACTDDTLAALRLAGCRVERITGDGTTLATILAER